MFKLVDEAALTTAFRPKDQKHLELTKDIVFPLVVKDYFAWLHPAGGRVFVVFATPGGVPTGIVFDSNGGSGPSSLAMCSWCHCSSAGTGVGLLTATVTGKRRVGVNVCSDLSCKDKLEQQANLGGASVRPAMEKMVSRMGQFAQDALGIDLSGKNR